MIIRSTNVTEPRTMTIKDLAMIVVSWIVIGNAVVAICQAIVMTVEVMQ